MIALAAALALLAAAFVLCLRARGHERRSNDAAVTAVKAAGISVDAARSAQATANQDFYDRQGSTR